MSLLSSTKRIAQLAVLALMAGEISAAAAQVLVLRSDGARASRHYRTGTRFPDDAVFDLRPGDSLVVLARGGTRTFRGPGAYSVGQPAQSYVLAGGRRVRIQTGVVRQPPRIAGVDPTQVWEYDTRQAGRLCVKAGARPLLWRPGSADPSRMTITALTGASHSFDWPAGATTMAWPDAVPVADGAVYLLASSRGREPVRVTARVLPAGGSDDLDTLAGTLVAQRCTNQLDTLIATRVDPSAPVIAESAAPGATTGRGP